LFRSFGINGAAMARAVLMVVSLGSSWLLLSRIERGVIDLDAFFRVLFCVLVEGGSVVVAEFAWYDRHLLGLYIALGGFVYLLSLRYLRLLKPQDMVLLYRLFPTKLRF